MCPLNVPRCRWGCHEFVRPIFLGPPSASPASPPESASTHWSPHPSWACCCCCCFLSCSSASPRHPPGRTCSSTTYSRRQCEAPFPADSPAPSTTGPLAVADSSAWDPHPEIVSCDYGFLTIANHTVMTSAQGDFLTKQAQGRRAWVSAESRGEPRSLGFLHPSLLLWRLVL